MQNCEFPFRVLVAGTWVKCHSLAAPGDAGCVARLKSLVTSLPDSYVEAMLQTDGIDGAVGDEAGGGWLVLYPCRDVIDNITNTRWPELGHALVLIGSDGGAEAYVLDSTTQEILQLPFMDFGDVGQGRLEVRFTDLASLMRHLEQAL